MLCQISWEGSENGRNHMRMLIATLCVLLLIGCATPLAKNQTRLTLQSDPPGATISSPSGNRGMAPYTLLFTIANDQSVGITEPITATWVSGAKTTMRIRLIGGQAGFYTFQRPQGAPGLESDIQWAIHVQQQQERRKAADDAAMANAINSLSNGLSSPNSSPNFNSELWKPISPPSPSPSTTMPSYTPKPTYNCYSTQSPAGGITTNCY